MIEETMVWWTSEDMECYLEKLIEEEPDQLYMEFEEIKDDS
jgi:ABC-type Zn2+ transport system substrate-binding protein/surface adhesin